MNEILLANLFFIITGSAVLVVAAFVCVACYHAIRIEKSERSFLKQVEIGAEVLMEDAKAFRERVAESGFFGRVLMAIIGALTHTVPKHTTSPKKKKDIIRDDA